MLDALPPVATAAGTSGRVVLSCEIAASAEATCSIEEESPVGAGFGAAALGLMRTVTFAPRIENGVPVASSISVPMNFPGNGDPAPIEGPINVTAVRGASGTAPLTEEQQRTRHYPQAAHLTEVEGEALVACIVRSAGNVECAVEREEPAGWGFGERAANIIATAASRHPGQTPGAVSRQRVRFALRNPDQARAPTFEQSEWAKTPTPAQLRAAYPSAAARTGREGRVARLGEFQADRTLRCAIEGEAPTGQGFGAAALEVAAHYELRADVLDRPGRAAGDRILLPVHFELAN